MAPDPTIEEYYTEEPYVPEGGEPLAKDIYENVQVLGDLTEDNFTRLMGAITQWVSPEEGCAYCHAKADDGAGPGSRRILEVTGVDPICDRSDQAVPDAAVHVGFIPPMLGRFLRIHKTPKLPAR